MNLALFSAKYAPNIALHIDIVYHPNFNRKKVGLQSTIVLTLAMLIFFRQRRRAVRSTLQLGHDPTSQLAYGIGPEGLASAVSCFLLLFM